LRRTASGFGSWAFFLLVGVVVIKATWDARGPGAAPGSQSQPQGAGGEESHGAPIWSVAFSPDGRYLAGTRRSGEGWLKDRSTGESSLLQQGITASARALAFAPDGKVLAVAGGGPSIRLWEVETGDELEALDVGGEATKSIAFAPD